MVVKRNPVPLLEVFALSSPDRGVLDSEQWNKGMSFPVPLSTGTNKIVRIDITRLVKYYVENPGENHGLIIGSLSGERRGLFSLQETFDSGVLGRIRYIYR